MKDLHEICVQNQFGGFCTRVFKNEAKVPFCIMQTGAFFCLFSAGRQSFARVAVCGGGIVNSPVETHSCVPPALLDAIAW